MLLVQIGREMFCIIICLAVCDGAEQSGRRCDDQIGKALIAGQFLREQPFEITAFWCAEPFLFVVRGIELDGRGTVAPGFDVVVAATYNDPYVRQGTPVVGKLAL